MLRKTPFALRFLREWLSWATSGEHITDAWDPARQHSGFQQHRHDQSILSLLAKRHRLKTFPLPTAAHDRRDIWAWYHVTKKLAHTSASWLSGGLSQRQIMLQAAPSLGQPRPISRLVPVGIGHTGLAFGIGVGCGLLRDYLASAQLPTGLRRVRDPL